MENKNWEKGLKAMQSKKTWELYRAGGLSPSLPRDPIKFIANSQEMAIIRGCNLLVFAWYRREGVREAELINLKPVATTYCQMEENDFCSYGERKDG